MGAIKKVALIFRKEKNMKKKTLQLIGVAALTGLIIVVVSAIQSMYAVAKFMRDTRYGIW